MYIIIGMLLIALEVLASRRNRRFVASLYDKKWLWVYRWRFVLGVPLAITSVFVSYPLSVGEDQYQVSGFPFMVMVIDQNGWDYVGFMSIPFLIINGFIWFCIPSLVLWGWSQKIKTRNLD